MAVRRFIVRQAHHEAVNTEGHRHRSERSIDVIAALDMTAERFT
jgi:hypothetical protein